jgi:hypothetical protein
VSEFICPAYLRALPGITAAQYIPSSDFYDHCYSYTITRTNNYPNSLLSGAAPFGVESPAQASLKVSTVASMAPLAQVWVMADMDWQCVDSPSGLGTDENYIAMTPVHIDVRNYFYFDGHSANKRVNGYTNF